MCTQSIAKMAKSSSFRSIGELAVRSIDVVRSLVRSRDVMSWDNRKNIYVVGGSANGDTVGMQIYKILKS